MTLLLIDIRSTLPTLLAQLNTPSAYTPTSTRLAAAFDILTFFVGHLVRSMDPASSPSSSSSSSPLLMPPDLLLKLRKSIAETLSVTIEHLRDRYDAATAGALGLHPDAIANLSAGGVNPAARPALAWDGAAARVGEDSLVLAAVRALAIWLREDDNDALRGEAAGLMDMLLDLYRDSAGAGAGTGAAPTDPSSRAGAQQHLDFRRPVLVALEGITATEEGAEAFLDGSAVQPGEGGGWEALSRDLLGIMQSTSASASPSPVNMAEEASRGLDIVRVLLPLVEAEQPGPREPWMAVVTAVAAWHVPDPDPFDGSQPPPPEGGGRPEVGSNSSGGGGGSGDAAESLALEFHAAALQLVTALLAGAHPGMRRRYAHSAVAVRGAVRQLMENARRRRRRRRGGNSAAVVDAGLEESLQDVLDTLGGLA